MQSLASPAHADDVTQTRREFDRWRRSRPRGERIPSALWEAAIVLAREHGVSKVSLALRLDYYALQRRITEASELMTTTSATQAGFVELSLPTAAPLRCQIELADHRGGTMRVELSGMSPQDLAAFVRSVSRTEP